MTVAPLNGYGLINGCEFRKIKFEKLPIEVVHFLNLVL